MLEKVSHYIEKHNLCGTPSPILIACSGGGDSMVLTDIMQKLNFKIGLAHCNFQLRGNESDSENAFVRDYAVKNDIPFYETKLETEKYAQENKISVQLAARELRYDWLEKIRKENDFHNIATAHHLNDQAETILLNFIKGSGVRGLKGIPSKNGKIIRPLLEISKQEIETYQKENNILFKSDSSNDSIKYQRNFLRHEVIPKIKSINPAFENNILSFSQQMNDLKKIVESYHQGIRKKLLTQKQECAILNVNTLKSLPAHKTVLYEILRTYNFNSNQLEEVYNFIQNPKTGKQFLSSTHRIIQNRKQLIIAPLNTSKSTIKVFEKLPKQILFNNYKIAVVQKPISKLQIKKSERFAYIDAKKVKFPLIIRYWKNGDYFYPYGLTKPKSNKVGKKKLSKYFKDEQFSILEKEQTPLLFSGNKLVWVVGSRIDDRFKVDRNTKNVIVCSMQNLPR